MLAVRGHDRPQSFEQPAGCSSSPASKENAAEMDCADVGDAHGPTLFARGMVVRTEVGRRTLLGFSQRVRIEPLLAVRHRRLHGTAGRRIYFGALLLGYYRRQTLVYAGKVGTGLGRDTLRRLGKKLAELKTPISPFEGEDLPRDGVHWVKPKLVAQIAFTEWTPEGKLRHPRFLGLRDDKNPEDVVRES
jgi:hypothetical protein